MTVAMPTIRERPIICTGESVRAIMAGRKTQTRRVISPQPGIVQWPPREHRGEIVGRRMWKMSARVVSPDWWGRMEIGEPPQIRPPKLGTKIDLWIGHEDATGKGITPNSYAAYCPKGAPGDHLWVKESWHKQHGKGPIVYAADEPDCKAKKTSPLYLPKRLSRIILEITEVRVERLQDISEEDADAEGCPSYQASSEFDGPSVHARDVFQIRWESINGKKRPWASNCWVWAISFRTIKAERAK